MSGITADQIEDFDSVYVPRIKASIQELYQKAIDEEGGKLNVWGFGAAEPQAKAEFERRFPGMELSSRGLRFGAGAAVIQAAQAGAENADQFGGAITVWQDVYRRGLIDTTVDWESLGVPERLIDKDFPGMIQTQVSGVFGLWYNKGCGLTADDLPDNPWDFLDAKWRNKLVATPTFFAGGLSYVALKFGESETLALGRQLLANGHLLTADVDTLVLSCERPILWPDTVNLMDAYAAGQNVDVKPYEGMPAAVAYSGIIKDTPHPNGALLWSLWNHFDRDWIEFQHDNPNDFATPPTHYLIPGAERQPVIRAMAEGLKSGWATWLDVNTMDERARLNTLMQQELIGG